MKDGYLKRLDRYRPRLLEELESLEDLAKLAAEDARPVELDQQSVGRLSRMDAMQRQAMASATQGRRELRRRQVLGALARMEEDEFGFCAGCGEEIPDARLDADAAAHRCVRCAG
ncbi:MAG TPA: TraR/DksA C4-type zinc finger protein [Propylenella sp.]